MAAARWEKARRASGPMPATSARPWRSGSHATPRRTVSSWRSWAWYSAPPRGRVGVDAAPVERREAPLGPTPEVGHHHVAVQVGVEGATDAVDEPRGGDGIGGDRHESPCGRATHGDGAALHVVERGVDGALVGGEHFARHLGGPRGVEHAHRLRRTEAEVEGGHRDPVVGTAQALAGQRIVALEHRTERVAVHLAVQAERGRARAQPPTGGLDAGARPVPGHLEVIGVAALAHLGHPQHRASRALRSGPAPEVPPGITVHGTP